eukprot:GHVU01180998.1.p1 GENE.GHVU01180998.1~~GHVU01180998.1.p1  ORF type:complete len:465 (+),score=67.55 GHVU01180998.1:43-1437(+)
MASEDSGEAAPLGSVKRGLNDDDTDSCGISGRGASAAEAGEIGGTAKRQRTDGGEVAGSISSKQEEELEQTAAATCKQEEEEAEIAGGGRQEEQEIGVPSRKQQEDEEEAAGVECKEEEDSSHAIHSEGGGEARAPLEAPAPSAQAPPGGPLVAADTNGNGEVPNTGTGTASRVAPVEPAAPLTRERREKASRSALQSASSSARRWQEHQMRHVHRHPMGSASDGSSKVLLSKKYRDQHKHTGVVLSDDCLAASGSKGWSTVLATHGSDRGMWYYEATVQVQESGSPAFIGLAPWQTVNVAPHVRLGFATRFSRFDLPVGTDRYGYSIRDVDGSAVNTARRYPYARGREIKPGDVVGCYLVLPPPTFLFNDPRDVPKLLTHFNAGLLCDPSNPPEPVPSKDSWIGFTINGEHFGHAFDHVNTAYYHPAVSLYMNAKVTVNFGPNFVYKPPAEIKPCSSMHLPPY